MTDESQLSQIQSLLLLALWDLSEGEFQGAKVPKTAVRNRVGKAKAQELNALLDPLGLVEPDGREERKECVRLTEAGKAALAGALRSEAFLFGSNTGAKTVNALLRWIRVMGSATVAAAPVAQSAAQATALIGSYDAFKAQVLDLVPHLDRSFNYAGYVPIWHLRQAIGLAVDRNEFNDYLFQMQADELVYLQASGARGITDQQKEDSVTSSTRGILFFVTLPEV